MNEAELEDLNRRLAGFENRVKAMRKMATDLVQLKRELKAENEPDEELEVMQEEHDTIEAELEDRLAHFPPSPNSEFPDESIETTTVEVDRIALATLIDETQSVIDSIDDPHWHDGYGEEVKEAVQKAEDTLKSGGEVQ